MRTLRPRQGWETSTASACQKGREIMKILPMCVRGQKRKAPRGLSGVPLSCPADGGEGEKEEGEGGSKEGGKGEKKAADPGPELPAPTPLP